MLLIGAFFLTLSILCKAAMVLLGTILGVAVFLWLAGLLITAALTGLLKS